MDSDFYREFEKHYRGSRELIKSRLQIYLPVIEPLKDFDSELTAIDLGCGRGEWIELINEMGFKAYGVDIDDGMLADCYERRLPAKKQDAINFIQTLDSDSHVIVTAFHVVEHISFENLQVLVREALRVLKPGGLLVMETPNPENISVATKNFYLDPTHKKPIPSELLAFLPEYYGFKKVKALGLQESKALAAGAGASLYAVISGASPDYAVVAQKNASTEILSRFDHVFDKNYGLSLETLAKRHDDQISLHIEQVGERAQKAESTAVQAESKAQKAEQTAENAQILAQEAEANAQKGESTAIRAESKAQKAEQTSESAEALAQEAEAKAQKAENTALQADSRAQQAQMLAEAFHEQLNAVYSSYSWRITWPLRFLLRIIKSVITMLKKVVFGILKSIILFPMRIVLARPRLAESVNNKLIRFCSLHRWLRKIWAGAGTVDISSGLSTQKKDQFLSDTFSQQNQFHEQSQEPTETAEISFAELIIPCRYKTENIADSMRSPLERWFISRKDS